MLPVEAQTIARAPSSSGLGHGDDHAAVLERAGRVLALDLEVQVAQPERRAEALGADERRDALAEGQRRRRVGHRQEPAIALDEARPRRRRAGDPVSHRSGTGCRWPPGATRRVGRAASRALAARRRGASAPRSSPPPRATAIRSPSTADEVAAPPAPGPSNPTRPTGTASISIRLRDAGRPAERRVARQRRRQDGRRDRRHRASTDARRHEPDDPADAPGVGLVGQADRRDARAGRTVGPVGPGRDRGRVQPATEGEAGQDDELVDRVEALDVAGRVRLRVAQALRLGERRRVVERGRLVGHRAQDEVGRAVDDAADAARSGSPARSDGQRPEDRDPAADRRLEPERRAGPPGDRLELRAVVGDDVLVGGDDGLAHRQRGGDQRVGRLVATHQLDDDVDVVVGHEVGRRVGDDRRRASRRRPHGPTSRTATAASWRAAPSDGRSSSGPVEERADDLAPDGPRAEHGDAQPGAAHDGVRAGRDIGPNGSRPVGATAG